MSGESPREEKIEDFAGRAGVESANQAKATCVTVTPTVERQRSRQQLIACWPFGQHDSCDVSECDVAVVWQSADIKGEVAANAVSEPCRPKMTINMTATNWRFTPRA